MHLKVDNTVRETVIVEEAGHKISPLPAYLHYGWFLESLTL